MRAILTYHSIDASGSPISCHPEAFERHVRWLASGPVQVTTLERLLTMPDSADAVAVTFDDAFSNFRDVAWPRLRAHDLPSTMFVVADHAGGTNAWGRVPDRGIPILPLLDWPAIGELAAAGVAIGSHGRTHRDLSGLAPADVLDEARGSAEAIERRSGIRPTAFAYPYGGVTREVAAVVAELYTHACTTELGAVTDAAHRARLPRIDAYYLQRPGLLESWGTPGFRTFLVRRRRLRRCRRLGERVVRRMLSLGQSG